MIRCIGCGQRISEDEAECPYCGERVNRAAYEQMETKKRMRTAQIDDVFGLPVYDSMPVEKLESMLAQIEQKLEMAQQHSDEQAAKLEAQISQMEDTLQSKYPLRAGIQTNYGGVSTNTVRERVEALLTHFNPPDVNSAAFNLRAGIEKCLFDRYGYSEARRNGELVMGCLKNSQGQVMSYFTIFSVITGSKAIARKCTGERTSFNWFVHQSKTNDDKLNKLCPSLTDKVNYLRASAEFFEKYKLI